MSSLRFSGLKITFFAVFKVLSVTPLVFHPANGRLMLIEKPQNEVTLLFMPLLVFEA
jgi:hypothetical protein